MKTVGLIVEGKLVQQQAPDTPQEADNEQGVETQETPETPETPEEPVETQGVEAPETPQEADKTTAEPKTRKRGK